MKKSEIIQSLIDIEMENKQDRKITMDYIEYLKMQKRLLETGDIEL